MGHESKIAYQCLNPHEDNELNKQRKECTYWVELMEQKIFSNSVPDLIPVAEWADNDKYQLYYLMYFGLMQGARGFRITNNETKEVLYMFTCNHLMEWIGEIPEEEKIKAEKIYSFCLGKKYWPPAPGIFIKD